MTLAIAASRHTESAKLHAAGQYLQRCDAPCKSCHMIERVYLGIDGWPVSGAPRRQQRTPRVPTVQRGRRRQTMFKNVDTDGNGSLLGARWSRQVGLIPMGCLRRAELSAHQQKHFGLKQDDRGSLGHRGGLVHD
jgi:hypothetical protein